MKINQMPVIQEFTKQMSTEEKNKLIKDLDVLVEKAKKYQDILILTDHSKEFKAYDASKQALKDAIVSCIEYGLNDEIGKIFTEESVKDKIKHWGKGHKPIKAEQLDKAIHDKVIENFKSTCEDFLEKSEEVKKIKVSDVKVSDLDVKDLDLPKDEKMYFLFRKYKKGGEKYDDNVGFVKFVKKCRTEHKIGTDILKQVLIEGGVTSDKVIKKMGTDAVVKKIEK